MINRLKSFFKKTKPLVKRFVHIHHYKFVSRTQTDALGVPYGYDKYRCSCGKEKERFWYVRRTV